MNLNGEFFVINDTISKIESKIAANDILNSEKKNELLDLIGDLKKEVVELSKDDDENATSIANFTSVSAYEAIKSSKNDKLLQLSIEGLSTSVRRFEVTHPDLTKAVNAVCNFLSNLGI